MDDLDDIDRSVLTEPGRTCLLCYPCGCTIKITDTWATTAHRCDDPDHQFIGNQVDP